LFIAYALSIRPRIISVALAIVLITGGLFALRSSERFDLAWRPETAQLNYYDQAKNLRVARDMARAGGWDGKWFDLRLPGDVRNNIHNDLMSAYLAGFFGWIILAIVLFAYLIFYTVLWRTIGEEGPPDDETPEVIHSSSLMVAFCSAIVAAFFVQNLWVFIQPLQSAVPLIGLDLVPVSTSGSSVLSILIIVLGSVFFCQTLRRSLENDGFASLEKS
jgi:cell division protein FtsW (lipid II flippase)